MSSRDAILKSIRRNLPQSTPLPELEGSWITYEDPIAQFRELLEGVGGELIEVDALEEIAGHLQEWTEKSQTIVSCVPGFWEDKFDFSAIEDPHQLENVDLAVLPGHLGVAENGAIWVDDEHVPERVLFFVTQHLALVIPRNSVLSNMYQAYQQITPAQRAFGCFICGPSKTADIEQSLVKGAHGARTLKVFLVGTMS
ncbi:MAG: LUD domain-containing protein [Planctomycetaceae bacterium]|nr:LUD domain-containing protein [Planctomycetaceae bacterium]